MKSALISLIGAKVWEHFRNDSANLGLCKDDLARYESKQSTWKEMICIYSRKPWRKLIECKNINFPIE